MQYELFLIVVKNFSENTTRTDLLIDIGDIRFFVSDLRDGAWKKKINGHLSAFYETESVFTDEGKYLQLVSMFAAFVVAKSGIVVEKDFLDQDKIVKYLKAAEVINSGVGCLMRGSSEEIGNCIKKRTAAKFLKRFFKGLPADRSCTDIVIKAFGYLTYEDFKR